MAICTHIVVTSIDETLTVAFDVKHCSAKYMPCIVCSDLDLSITELYRFMKLNRANFIDAVLYHFTIEAVYFALLCHGHFSEILQHQWNNRFGRRCGYDGATVPDSLGEVRKGSTVIQMEMRHQNGIDHMCQVQV